MQVSVIIPMYNSQAWIGKTLKAVLAQSLRPMEIIVVDDGSTDNSPDIVREFPSLVLLKNPGKGANFARSWGFKHSKAPLIAFLDSDDLWHPDHLQFMARIFAQHSSTPAAVAERRSFLTSKENIFQTPLYKPAPFQPWDSFPFAGIDTPSAMVIRRKSLENIGGVSTQFGEIFENHLALKLSTLGPLIKNQCITVGRRIHKHQLSNTLRISDPEDYFDTLLASLSSVLKFKIRQDQDAGKKLNDRFQVMQVIRHILHAVIHKDEQNVKVYTQNLKAISKNQSPLFINKTYESLAWWIMPVLYRHEFVNQRILAEIILAAWPDGVEQTRHLMTNNLPALLQGLSP